MTLEQIRREAELKAVEIDIQWERMMTPTQQKEFEDALEVGTVLIPDLESLYTKLTSGESVAYDGEASPLPYDDQEKYAELVGDQLFEAYIIREVLHKYKCITNILNLAYPLDKDPNAD
jgi:hypothetical protein